MIPTMVDTDILSMYFRGNKAIAAVFERYIQDFGRISISIISYYEIISGLKYRDAKQQLALFKQFVDENEVMPLTEDGALIAGQLYAQLRSKGQTVDDIDLLIAGIAIANNMALATNNEKHFQRIENLNVFNWSKQSEA